MLSAKLRTAALNGSLTNPGLCSVYRSANDPTANRGEPMFSRSEDIALLFGRLFVAALFLPSAFSRALAISSFAAKLGAKGLPYSTVIAAILVTAEVFGTIALIIAACHA